MALTDYLVFENPGVVAIAIGVLVFVVVYTVLSRFIQDRGSTMIISLVLGLIGGWSLYVNNFFGGEEENLIAILFIIVVVGIVLRILWRFIRGTSHRFGR